MGQNFTYGRDSMFKKELNKSQSKLRWTDDEKRYFMKNSKEIYIEDLSVMMSKTVQQCIDAATRIGCGYISKKSINNK